MQYFFFKYEVCRNYILSLLNIIHYLKNNLFIYVMCGIFGYISNNLILSKLLSNNKLILDISSEKCKHRGPDSSESKIDVYQDFQLYFKFHRLAINGLDEISKQPMTRDNVTILCNGEIYNYKELAKKYSIELKTNSDCEIILELYHLIGIQLIKELDGVFSFIIFDKNNGLIYVGHDPIGIRSLYMIQNEEELIISSEMKCLTEFKGEIKMVEPGVYIEYNLNNKQYEKLTYYNIYYQIKHKDEIFCIEMIQKLLTNAVKKRLLTDRPFGCLLSGGLDSSIITAIVNKLINEKELSKKKVNTFSIGLENSPDLIHAEKMALHIGTNHKSFIVSEKEMLEAIEPTIQQIESYDTTTVRASVPMYLLSKFIREKTDVKVIFSGEGADELSGSYLYFHNAPSPKDFQNECERLIQNVQFFDVLRGDKTTAGNGLEIRVPFFDKTFVNEYMSIDPELKIVRNGFEKYLLRKSFEKYLPEEVAWRRKDGFSDGVSKNDRPWYQIINEYTQKKFGMNEKEYYMSIFQKYYKNNEKIIPYEWLPKWCDQSNPSGRLILNQ